MKKVGIVVCNYNKSDYVIPCLDSIYASNFHDFDVYVVDNASTDDSVKRIKERFGDIITLIVNPENFGGSGGFNTGLRRALTQGYPYIMCVDNDILMDINTISSLYEFLEKHSDVGMVGSKICFMDEPNRIQSYGDLIDFDEFEVKDLHRGCLSDGELPEMQYCDFVPACSLMARADAVRKVGLMPEDNFIYWDDMEWGYCFGLAGYKIAAVNASKVLHKGGKNTNPTTFQKYYMVRNRIHFFMKYLEERQKEKFAHTMLCELYRSMCGCYLKKEYNMVKGFMYAYEDALHGVRGKAAPSRILPRVAPDRFKEVIQGNEKILIQFDGNYRALSTLKKKLVTMLPITNITIRNMQGGDCQKLQIQYPDCNVVEYDELLEYDILFQICPHIFQTGDVINGAICVDQWLNLLVTEEDYNYSKNFYTNQNFFLMCNKDIFLDYLKGNSV